MQYHHELMGFVRYGKLPRPPDPVAGVRRPRRVRRDWRWRSRPAVAPPRPIAPDPVPGQAAPLDIHEYLELEFAVGPEGRR
jgi:hypothetical protein